MRAGCPLTFSSIATSPGSDPREIGVSTSKDSEGADLWVCRGSSQVFLLQPFPHWSIWRGGIGLGKAERKGLFLKLVPFLEFHWGP